MAKSALTATLKTTMNWLCPRRSCWSCSRPWSLAPSWTVCKRYSFHPSPVRPKLLTIMSGRTPKSQWVTMRKSCTQMRRNQWSLMQWVADRLTFSELTLIKAGSTVASSTGSLNSMRKSSDHGSSETTLCRWWLRRTISMMPSAEPRR